MSERHDDKIEAMLRFRRLEPASPDLAERIIVRAQRLPQRETIRVTQWLQRIFAECRLPQPAYVLSCSLALGFLIGFMMPADLPRQPDMSVQSFLYFDEDIL